MAADAKVEHLKLIQSVVSRMASNSFLLKGWSVTLVAAVMALRAKEAAWGTVFAAACPLLAFGYLDIYYLTLERRYRKLYDAARAVDGEAVDYSLDTTPYLAAARWWGTAWSRVTWFYVALGVVVLVFALC